MILGIEVTLSPTCAHYRPEDEKMKKWLGQIERILADGALPSGEASKLAGALQWAAQHTFHRLGRAMLSPIFRYVPGHGECVSHAFAVATRAGK